jgi:hypothetical protein
MCKWLEVSRSGFYDWKSRPESGTAQRRELLRIKVKALFEANGAEYGYRRLHRALARGGERCSPELVRRLMRELGLVPCQPRPWRHSLTEQDGLAADIPDLVRREFTAERPGQKNGGGHYLHPDLAGLALSSCRDRLRDAEDNRVGDGRQL